MAGFMAQKARIIFGPAAALDLLHQ